MLSLSLSACALTSKAPNFNGLKEMDGSEPMSHINLTKFALHFAIVFPFIGDASLEGAVQDFTKEAKKEGAQSHLKLQLEANPLLDVIGFQLAGRIGLTEGPIDLAFKASIDEWNGNKRVSLKLKDLRTAV
jgi:hypothetical protein